MVKVLSGFQRPSNKVLIMGAAGAFVALAFIAGFFAWQYFSVKNNPNKQNEDAIARVTAAVGSIYMLPDEKPTVAQIQDKEKLKGQPFFDKAENGDYVLVYKENKLALLYRDKDHKLVNVGPVNTDQNAQQTTDATTKK